MQPVSRKQFQYVIFVISICISREHCQCVISIIKKLTIGNLSKNKVTLDWDHISEISKNINLIHKISFFIPDYISICILVFKATNIYKQQQYNVNKNVGFAVFSNSWQKAYFKFSRHHATSISTELPFFPF